MGADSRHPGDRSGSRGLATPCPRRGSSRRPSARLEYDLVLAGADTSDGGAGVVAAGVAALPGLPYLSYAARIEPDPAAGHGPRPPDQPDRLRRPRGADARARRRDPGPRRAALPVAQGDHGRPLEGRSPPGRSPTSASTRGRSAGPSPRVASWPPGHPPPGPRPGSSGSPLPRPPPASSTSSPSGGSSDGRTRSGSSRRRRPTAAWHGSAPRSRRSPGSSATAGRPRGRRRGRRGGPGGRRRGARGVPAAGHRRHGARGRRPRDGEHRRASAWPALVERRGRDARCSWRRRAGWPGRRRRRCRPCSAGASSPTRSAVTWAQTAPTVEMSVFGGKLLTTSAFTQRAWNRDRPPERGRRRAGARGRDGRRRRPWIGELDLPLVPGPRAGRRGRRGRADRGGHGSSSPAAGASAARRASGSSRSWPRRSAARSGRRRAAVDAGWIPYSPADRPDGQDRQAGAVPRARDLRARSSTRSGCRRPRRSSPSTATRTRRSPSSPTSSSSATCSRSGPRSWWPSSAPGRAEAGARAGPRCRTCSPSSSRSWRWPRSSRSRWRSRSSCVAPRWSIAETRDVERFRQAVERPRGAGRSVARRGDRADRRGPPTAMLAADAIEPTTWPPPRTPSSATPRRRRALHGLSRRKQSGPTSSPSWSGPAGRSRWSSPRLHASRRGARRPPRARGADCDQAWLPQCPARPRGDRPGTRPTSPSGRPADQRRWLTRRLRLDLRGHCI